MCNDVNFLCEELHPGTRARGHPAGSSRAEERDFWKCRKDIRVPQPALSTRTGAMRAIAHAGGAVLPQTRKCTDHPK